MKYIKIDNNEYNVPDSWEELTLQQYLDLMSIPSGFTPSNKLIKIFEYTCGIPVEVSKKISPPELVKINSLLNWMDKSYVASPIREFLFKNVEYKAESISDSVFGAYVDYETFLDRYGAIQGLPYLIAVMARKQGEKYEDYDTYKRAEEFKELPLTVALDLAAFFLTNIKLTNLHTQTISKLKEQVQNQSNYTNNLLNSLDGKSPYLKRLQIKMLRKLKKYLDSQQPLL